MMNFQKMMQQAQQVQFKLAEMQERLKEMEVEGTSGGGLVKVGMNCAGQVFSVDIDPSLIRAEEKETLEDLVVAAINSAHTAKDDRVREETKSLMREMGLPEDAQFPM